MVSRLQNPTSIYEDPNPYASRAEALMLDVSTGKESSIDLQWPKGMEMMSPLGLLNSPIRPIPDGFLAFLTDERSSFPPSHLWIQQMRERVRSVAVFGNS
jgi:hypothetical protein